MVGVFLVCCWLLCLEALSSMSLWLGAPAPGSFASASTYGQGTSPCIFCGLHRTLLLGSPCLLLPGFKRCNRSPPNPMSSFLPLCQFHEGRDLLSLLLYSQHLQQCPERRRCSSNYGINFSQLLFAVIRPLCSLWIQDVTQRVTEVTENHH